MNEQELLQEETEMDLGLFQPSLDMPSMELPNFDEDILGLGI